MKCIDCRFGALRDKDNQQRDETLRRMAKLGNINCTKSFCRSEFHQWQQVIDCDMFETTDEPTKAARVAYFHGSTK